MVSHCAILTAALLIDWYGGEPRVLWDKFPHPVVWFGRLIDLLDRRLNPSGASPRAKYRDGALAWIMMMAAALAAGLFADWLIGSIARIAWPAGWIAEALIVSVFIAQKSLKDHVGAVASALRTEGIAGGRRKIAKIVGRDPADLDRAGICRAAVESLAENFSDGVIAPALWYGVFGLPGLFIYKMINTADSMIGHRSEKYLHFGRVAAQADDLANWLPARVSAFLIALGAMFVAGWRQALAAFDCALRDSGLHPSPNAGWPEAAMAGAGGFALGGPRSYGGVIVQQSRLNAAGRTEIGVEDVLAALKIFTFACFVFWVIAAACAFGFTGAV